jgi:hypothetical protein
MNPGGATSAAEAVNSYRPTFRDVPPAAAGGDFEFGGGACVVSIVSVCSHSTQSAS